MDTSLIIIAIAGGLLAGIINTLAGNGSAITLSILTELIGLPGNMANGTNRVGIFMQGLASSSSFVKNRKVDIALTKWPMIYCIIGALIGVAVAVTISNELFKDVFKYLLVVLLFVVIVKPKRWLSTPLAPREIKPVLMIPAYLALGFYGGFIQMGMGVVFLAVTVLIMRYNIIVANVMKTLIVTVYTLVVLVIFQLRGLIDWEVGLIIAVGQATGGYLAAEFASKVKGADRFAYYLLVAVMIIAIASAFGLFR